MAKCNWTMAEAKQWVKDHKSIDYNGAVYKYKERWNKSLSKLFDVERVDSQPSTFEYALLEKFLECPVSQIFKNTLFIPSPLLANRLDGIKEALKDFTLKDTRNFRYDGKESPPEYEVLQLSSTESEDFLIKGTAFYDADNTPLVVSIEPVWGGMIASFATAVKHKEWNKELLQMAQDTSRKNNKLRGEKFALNGGFIPMTGDEWDNLILDPKTKDAIVKSVGRLDKDGAEAKSRGMLFVGCPGVGKTLTGRVMLNNVDSTFIWISSKDFKDGRPLKSLSLAFEMARELAPTVLFIEDIDTWLDGTMTDLLKTELDGIRQNKGVLTILTSNYPERLPDALIDRPGRFHHVLDFVLPKDEQRREMIEKWAGEIDEKTLDSIIERTAGFSGAHMFELVEFAKMSTEDDEINIDEALIKSLDRLMEQKELIEEIREAHKETGLKDFMAKVEAIEGEKIMKKKDIEKAPEGFECECIECGHKLTAKPGVHCLDIVCPECDGKMRRVERPGPGKSADDTDEKAVVDVDGLLQEVPMIEVVDPEPLTSEEEANLEPDDEADLKEAKEIVGQIDEIKTEIRITDLPELQAIISNMESQLVEIKEGRILSAKSRKIVKTTLDSLGELSIAVDEAVADLRKLYDATDPGSGEGKAETTEETKDVEVEVIDDRKPEEAPDIEALIEQKLQAIFKDTDKIQKLAREAAEVEYDKIRGRIR